MAIITMIKIQETATLTNVPLALPDIPPTYLARLQPRAGILVQERKFLATSEYRSVYSNIPLHRST